MHRGGCTCPRCYNGRRNRIVGVSIALALVGAGFGYLYYAGYLNLAIAQAGTNEQETTIDTSNPQPKLNITQLEKRIHVLINEERMANGLSLLAYDDELAGIAREHSLDMVVGNYFAHVNLEGQDPTSRAEEAGYDCYKDFGDYYVTGIAENLYQDWLYSSYKEQSYTYGTETTTTITYDWQSQEELARAAVSGWMNSPGHRANILESDYDREGIGVSVDITNAVYVTQNFC